MPKVNLENLGMAGLNSDAPAQTLDITTFNDGNNFRPFDGSIQACFGFGDNETKITGDNPIDVYALTQWTKSGEGTLNVAVLYDPTDGDGQNLSFRIVEDISQDNIIPVTVAATPVDDNSRFGLDMFVFNDVVVINDGSNHPVWVSRDTGGTYTTKLLPGWPLGAVTDPENSTEYFNVDEDDGISDAEWRDLLGTQNGYGTEIPMWLATNNYTAGDFVYNAGYYRALNDITGASDNEPPADDSTNWAADKLGAVPTVGARFTTKASGTFTTTDADGIVGLGTPTSVERIVPFNNRLVALNVSEEYIGSEAYGNTTMLWSTQITALGTLEGITFVASSLNSAGDDIITETPGEILDAGPLGNQLMIYKEDAVFYCADSGDPLYLVTQLATGDDGLYSPQCFVDIGKNRHLIAGNYGIYTFDGGINKENLSRGRIERSLYDSVDFTRRDRSFTFHHQADKEVWFCYADDTANLKGCNKAFVFNYELNTWYKRDLVSGTDGFRGITSTELSGEIVIYGWGSGGVFPLASERGDFNDRTKDGFITFEKQDFGDSTITKSVHELNPYCSEKVSIDFIMQSSIEPTLSKNEFGDGARTFDPASQYKMDYRLHGRFFDLKISQVNDEDNNGLNPQFTGIDIDIKAGGRR